MEWLDSVLLLFSGIVEVFLNYIVFAMLKQVSSKSKQRMTNRLFILYLCVPVITLIEVITIFYSGIDFERNTRLQIMLIVFFVAFLLENMLFFYTFQRYTENLSENSRQQMELLQQRVELERMTKITQLNENYYEMVHNISYYMKAIGQLAYENQTEAICKMVEEISGELNREHIVQYSYHKLLNTILSDYKEKAKEGNVAFDAYVEPGCKLDKISNMDFVTMLGNILDNAVTAAKKKEQGFVLVRIFMDKNGKICIIKVVNDFTGVLKKRNGKLLTTKKQDGIHGVGLISVEKAAEKYGGYVEYYVEDARFHTVLVLPV